MKKIIVSILFIIFTTPSFSWQSKEYPETGMVTIYQPSIQGGAAVVTRTRGLLLLGLVSQSFIDKSEFQVKTAIQIDDNDTIYLTGTLVADQIVTYFNAPDILFPQMRAGLNMKVVMLTSAGQTISNSFSLIGFTAAEKKVK